MATADYVIANQSGAAFRTDLNNTLAAIVSNNSNSSEPATKYAYQWWADTSANIFKIRNSSNNAWINLFSLAGGIDVDAQSNFRADIRLHGTGNKDFFFDASAGTMLLDDNAKMIFGTDSDLQIFNDGTNSFIKDNAGASFTIAATESIAIKTNNSEFAVAVNKNAGVELFFDGTKAAETSSLGFAISGDKTLFIGSAGDLRLGHDGSKSFVLNENSNNNLELQSNGGVDIMHGTEYMARFIADGNVVLMFDSQERLKVDNTICCALDNSAGTSGKGIIGFGNSGMPFIAGLDTGNHGSGSKMEFFDGDGDLFIQCLRNSIVRFYADGADQLFTNTFGLQMKNDKKILFKKETSTSGSVVVLDFQKDNPTNNVGDISMTNSAVTYNTGSDYRLKENERPIDDAIEKVKLLKPYYFNFIETPETLSQGFYAHEVSDIVPTAVKGEKDQVALNGMPIYQSVDYSKIVPMLAAGLKALIEKVEKLEAA